MIEETMKNTTKQILKEVIKKFYLATDDVISLTSKEFDKILTELYFNVTWHVTQIFTDYDYKKEIGLITTFGLGTLLRCFDKEDVKKECYIDNIEGALLVKFNKITFKIVPIAKL